MEYLDFIVPQNEPADGRLSTTIIFPSGETKGTFGRMLNGDHNVKVYVNTVLTEVGSYKVLYNTPAFTKNSYFFVGSTPNDVQLDVIEFAVRNGILSLNIANSGKETALVHYRVFNNEAEIFHGKSTYNNELVHEIINIRAGYNYEYHQNVGSSDLTLLLNEEIIPIGAMNAD